MVNEQDGNILFSPLIPPITGSSATQLYSEMKNKRNTECLLLIYFSHDTFQFDHG